MLRRAFAPLLKKYQKTRDMILGKTFNLSDVELNEYQTLTFLSKPEIKRAYRLFLSLDPELEEDEKYPSIDHDKILSMPSLSLNPFKDRIIKVFSPASNMMTFEEFLHMMSVFSDKAPFKVKAEYAFRIYDFGEDDMIGDDDILEMLKRLKGNNTFTEEDYEEIIHNLMFEGDIDVDGFMTFPEFLHMLEKCQDFSHSFTIKV